jgi:hypothetical protein
MVRAWVLSPRRLHLPGALYSPLQDRCDDHASRAGEDGDAGPNDGGVESVLVEQGAGDGRARERREGRDEVGDAEPDPDLVHAVGERDDRGGHERDVRSREEAEQDGDGDEPPGRAGTEDGKAQDPGAGTHHRHEVE